MSNRCPAPTGSSMLATSSPANRISPLGGRSRLTIRSLHMTLRVATLHAPPEITERPSRKGPPADSLVCGREDQGTRTTRHFGADPETGPWTPTMARGRKTSTEGRKTFKTDQDPGPWTGKPESGQGLDQRSLPEGGLLHFQQQCSRHASSTQLDVVTDSRLWPRRSPDDQGPEGALGVGQLERTRHRPLSLMPSTTVAVAPSPQVAASSSAWVANRLRDGLRVAGRRGSERAAVAIGSGRSTTRVPPFGATWTRTATPLDEVALETRVGRRDRSIGNRHPVAAVSLGTRLPRLCPLDVGRGIGVDRVEGPPERSGQFGLTASGTIEREVVGDEPLSSHGGGSGTFFARLEIGA